MWYYVNPELWSVNDDFHKAARSLVAAYLNASYGIGYAYSTGELEDMWALAYSSGTLLELHNELDAANNAYYRADLNEIAFPAAILQPPFFDPNADPAVNYGSVGGVIGHEMGHGYDDQGAKSDEKGILRTWWQPEDERRFKALTTKLAAQYSGYSPIEGQHVNGDV